MIPAGPSSSANASRPLFNVPDHPLKQPFNESNPPTRWFPSGILGRAWMRGKAMNLCDMWCVPLQAVGMSLVDGGTGVQSWCRACQENRDSSNCPSPRNSTDSTSSTLSAHDQRRSGVGGLGNGLANLDHPHLVPRRLPRRRDRPSESGNSRASPRQEGGRISDAPDPDSEGF
jgi:hypothetical protein